MTEEDYLQISGIQHFCFCRRRWALIHIEDQWNENELTAEGRLQHERVHDVDVTDLRNGVLTVRGMRIKSDRLGICGVCDAVEFTPDDGGIILRSRAGKWRACPVEYKHGDGKNYGESDQLQLAAQAVCLEEMLCCEVKTGFLFYAKTRHRERVEIDAALRAKLNDVVCEMRGYYVRHYTPKVKPGKACNRCSLVELCLPKLMRGCRASVRDYVRDHVSEAMK